MEKKQKWDYLKVGNVSRKNSKFLKGHLVLDDIPEEAIHVNEEGKRQVMISLIPRKDNQIVNVSWPSIGWHPTQQATPRSRESVTGRNTQPPPGRIGPDLSFPMDDES